MISSKNGSNNCIGRWSFVRDDFSDLFYIWGVQAETVGVVEKVVSNDSKDEI